MPLVDLARGAVGEAMDGGEDRVPPEGRAPAIQGGDRQQLGQLAAGGLVRKAVRLLDHAHGAEGEAVDGAAGDVGGEARLGGELGALVVGEVEGRVAIGLGKQAQGDRPRSGPQPCAG
jgi:hypothetical protein